MNDERRLSAAVGRPLATYLATEPYLQTEALGASVPDDGAVARHGQTVSQLPVQPLRHLEPLSSVEDRGHRTAPMVVNC